MVVELAAVRLLAPWFGTSQVVWANVIAVVLFALALGYALGGRLSGSGRDLSRLGVVLLLAAVGTAWLPALAAPVAGLFLPPDLALHEAAATVLWGSLAASLLLFLPAATVLGCVSPLAVEAVAETSERGAGAAGGLVLAASTLGSLAGVFATTLYLVPELGLAGGYRVAAGLLLLAGFAAILLDRGRRRDLAAPGGLALLLLAPALIVPPGEPRVPEGTRVLARVESPYQSIRIVERMEGDRRMRFLQVNEGFDSYQSVWQERPGMLPLGYYYNDVLLPSAWARALGEKEDPGDPWRVLILGLGGGTALRVLEGGPVSDAGLDAVGVELDRAVVDLAREFLDLAPEGTPGRLVLSGFDARFALRVEPIASARFDQIFLDCYANQVEIPPHLVTQEFVRMCEEHLAPGGWLQMNLGGFGFEDPVVRSIARTTASTLGTPVLLLRVPFARNLTLLARPGAELPVTGSGLAPVGGAVQALLEPRSVPGSWQLVSPDANGSELLVDDHAPIERLQERSLVEAGRRLLDPSPWRGFGVGL